MPERRAMVAEDSLLILVALEILLERHGIRITGQAATLAEAQALAESGDFDIAILDVKLHDRRVFPVADLLRQRGIPTIFTTGYALGDLLPARFADIPILQKPYDDDVLMVLVEHALAGAGAQHTT